MKTFDRTLIRYVSILFLLFASPGQAQTVCKNVFQASAASEYWNSRTAEKFPTLAFVLKDPDGFIAQNQEKFRLQKLKDPGHPYGFDYSQVGMPLLRDISQYLRKKTSEISDAKRDLETKSASSLLSNRLTSRIRNYELHEYETATAFLADLDDEVSAYLQTGTVTYQKLIEVSYFFARAVGYFDAKKQGPVLRFLLYIDRRQNGYVKLPIDQEYENYKSRKFAVFQKQSSNPGFRSSEQSFQDAFHNDQDLSTLWLPTNLSLDREILMRLLSKKINLIGVTYDPIMADGVLRPGGDFWTHDVRHESAKFQALLDYVQKAKITDGQLVELLNSSEGWLIDYQKELAQVQDPDLREAIDHLAFNFHHDRGFPFLPSVYLQGKPRLLAWLLYLSEKYSGQGVAFSRPIKHLKLANDWLRAFWMPRLAAEERLLNLPQ